MITLGNKIKLTIESSEYLTYSFSCISLLPSRLINELNKNSRTIVNSDTGWDDQAIPYLRGIFVLCFTFSIYDWRQSNWAVAGCDYCWAQIHCVTTGSGNLKLMFADGNKLTVESSEYQFNFLISCRNRSYKSKYWTLRRINLNCPEIFGNSYMNINFSLLYARRGPIWIITGDNGWCADVDESSRGPGRYC